MVRYVLNGPIDGGQLNALFDEAWPRHERTDLGSLLESSLLHVLAYRSDTLVGFVRVEGCGGVRGFVMGPTVHPDFRRQGIGTALLNEAAAAAQECGLKTLHVEFAPGLRGLYTRAGFRHTAAGVRRLSPSRTT